MLEHRFYHEVLGPLIRLRARSAENVCVQERNNDVIVLAQEAATAAYHFPEAVHGKPTPMSNSTSEILRQKLSDVVDSRKHGTLRAPERQISLDASLAYEVNDVDEFKYLGTQVWANNKRFGSFDLGNTVEVFVEEIRNSLSIEINYKLELPSYPFSKKIVTYVTDKTFYAQNVGLRFFRRTGNGTLLPVGPKSVELEVRELAQDK